jgi:hypothetical protein
MGSEEMNMRFLSHCFIAVLLLLGCVSAGQAQDKEKPFPSNDEINLLLTQGDRAMEQYKAAVNLEEMKMEKTAKEAGAVAKDRDVYAGWAVMSKGMKTKPQAFNGRFGVEIVLLLDDASRNSMVCSSQAALRVTSSKSVSDAQSVLQLAQTCLDTSTLIYTVSENAAALYRKYLEAAEQLTNQTADVPQTSQGSQVQRATYEVENYEDDFSIQQKARIIS